MKSFLAVSLILLGISSSSAQEHTTGQPSPRTRSASQRRTQTTTRRRGSAARRRGSRTATLPKTVDPPLAGYWQTFTSPEGWFSVLMPGTPVGQSETFESEPGPYTTHMFISREDPQRVYSVGWVDYHPAFNFNRVAEMEANRDNFVKGVGGRLLSSRTLMIDGWQALEFTVENEDKVFKSRVLIVGRRPYQIVIGSPKGVDDSAKVNYFFNSFKVTLR